MDCTDTEIFGPKTSHGIQIEQEGGTMRRFYLGILAVVLCIVVFFAGRISVSPAEVHAGGHDTEECGDTALTQAMLDSLSANSYLYSINHPIEKAFFEDDLRKDSSTGGAVSLYSKYAELWKEEMETYSTLIQTELSGDALEAFQNLQQTWVKTNEEETVTYAAIQEIVHKGGSIRAINAAKYPMEAYRAQALKLIVLYEEVMTGRGWSWRYQSQENFCEE